MNGKTQKSETMLDSDKVIPFASNSENDLMQEMNKYLKVMFEDQNSETYTSMMNKLDDISKDARSVETTEENKGRQYIQLNEYEYQYYETLKQYVPQLLKKERFFKTVFS